MRVCAQITANRLRYKYGSRRGDGKKNPRQSSGPNLRKVFESVTYRLHWNSTTTAPTVERRSYRILNGNRWRGTDGRRLAFAQFEISKNTKKKTVWASGKHGNISTIPSATPSHRSFRKKPLPNLTVGS